MQLKEARKVSEPKKTSSWNDPVTAQDFLGTVVAIATPILVTWFGYALVSWMMPDGQTIPESVKWLNLVLLGVFAVLGLGAGWYLSEKVVGGAKTRGIQDE